MNDGLNYLVVAHLVLWLTVSVIVLSDKYTERKKAILQSAFAFLIPVVGSLIVLAVNVGLRMKPKKLPDREMGQSIDEHTNKYYTGGFLP